MKILGKLSMMETVKPLSSEHLKKRKDTCLGRLKQEDHKFKACLAYRKRLSQKTKQKHHKSSSDGACL